MKVPGVILTPEALRYIAAKAASIHHGRIVIELNADKASKADIFVEERERFCLPDPE